MIEFLSDGNWLAPQIDFLLFLQNIRVSHFEMFDKLFLSITILGEFWLPALICAIVYWCIDSKAGIYMFSTNALSNVLMQLGKMIACVYRPWVLSDKIHPVKDAITFAKGYSFPSGHSAMSSSTFGSLALLLRKKFAIVLLLISLILLVGFSRMWLGVHTPQDVVAGFLIGIFLIFATYYTIEWAEKDKNRYIYLLILINATIAAILVYICYFAVYPIDYVDGKILVNPNKSIAAAILCYGYAAGILNGCGLCRRYFPFDAKSGSVNSKVIRGTIGTIILIALLKNIFAYFFTHSGDYKIMFASTFFVGFFITAIYPYFFTRTKLYTE